MKKIPNFDSLSTLLDRLAIENVKLAMFESKGEDALISGNRRDNFKKKAETQVVIINALKSRLNNYMKETFIDKNYEYIDETRTFNMNLIEKE